MARSSLPRAADLRAVHALAHDCRDLADDPAVWWPLYARRLAGLAAADFAGCGEVADLRRDRATTLGIGEWGWDNGFDREPWDRSVEMFDADPGYSDLYRRYFDRLAADPGACLARTDLMADRDWTRSVSFRLVNEPMGVDHYLWCYTPAAGGRWAVSVFTRAAGRPDFTARQKAVVRAANAVVAPWVGGRLASFRDPSPAALPPRARAVLRCFLEGDSDKQVATRLALTRHTVNGYAKVIHRHFGVRSRAELLARWVRRGWPVGGWAVGG